MLTLSIVPTDEGMINLIGALNAVGSGMGFRKTERALSAITVAVKKSWQNSVGPDHRIQSKKITPFSHMVFSEDKVVHWLEVGLPAFDMKKTHPYGRKARIVKPRIGKDGKPIFSWTQKRKDGSTYTVHAGDPYLIIPFRHKIKDTGREGKKGLADVYESVQEQMGEESFQRSRVKKSAMKSGKVSPNFYRESVERATYKWGTRIDVPQTEEFSDLQGMAVMGSKKHSQFMTFRIVSVNSPLDSWQHPGIEARHNLQNIMENGSEKIQTVVENAMRQDLGQ